MENAIFIGDLARDVDQNQICSLLYRLNVHKNVQPSDIEVHRRAGRNGYTYAFVYLNSERQMHYVLNVLKSGSNRNIILNSRILKEGCNSVRATKKRPSATNQTNHIQHWQQTGYHPQQGFNHNQNGRSQGSQPKIHIPSNNASYNTNYSGKTYILGENIGNETRDREYKKGGEFFMQRTLEDNVSKYSCGFLNSKGGTLFVGVNDDGRVEGIGINHQEEDQYRLRIDRAIKNIQPTVIPSNYTVDFFPVMDSFGRYIGERKILEIKIIEIEFKENLYATGAGKVYMRRDGSLEEWNATQIQYWHQKKKEDAIKKERQEKEQLQQMLNKDKHSHQFFDALSSDLQKKKELEKKLENERQIKEQMERDKKKLEREIQKKEQMERDMQVQAELKEKEFQRELQVMAQREETLENQLMEQKKAIERLQKKSKVCLIL